jgi:hypothetical protein
MTPRFLLRTPARVLPLLLLLATPNTALSQPLAPDPGELAPEARGRLAEAAEDSQVAPWQRDLMLRLARGGTAAAVDSPVPDRRAESHALSAEAADGAWGELVVRSRCGHSAIYDPERDRMVVFGGRGVGLLDDVWELSLAGTPTWRRLTPTGTPPSARNGQSAICDPVRDRMVVFGGGWSEGAYFGDVWSLSLSDTPAWTQLMPTGTPPSARATHSAIYDPERDRMVVFGGYNVDGSGVLNDVWALSLDGTPAWTQLSPTGASPNGRGYHSAIYDPVRDRMVAFGGYSSGALHNDVWALSLAGTPAWTQLTPMGTPPGAREGQSAIYDPERDRMVVFGGYVWGTDNDVWALSLGGTAAWTPLAPTGPLPGARYGHTSIYDPLRDRMVVFGGYNVDGSGYLNDVWALSLAETPAWTQLTSTDTPPSTRCQHSAIYDPVRDRMVVFGGHGTGLSGAVRLNDVWALSLGGVPAWTQLMPTGAPPCMRENHSAVYDPVRDRMVLFGGWSPEERDLNDVWELSLAGTPVWTELTPTGTPPSPRYNHSAIYDAAGDRMVVFGGSNLNDVWELSLAGTPAWTQLTPTGTPPSGRYVHSAIYDPARGCMVVFGGYGSGFLNDVWELSLAGTPAWTLLAPTGTPPCARRSHSAVCDPVRDRMVVFGGYGSIYPYDLDDVWALSLSGTLEWTQLTPAGTAPSARGSHSALYDPVRHRMVVFGGSHNDYLNDVWALGWSTTVAVSDPPARSLISGLRPPVPNPACGTMSVSYALARAGRVQLGIFDVSGRLVRTLVDGERRAGVETVVWNGTAESGARSGAGVFFVRLAGPGLRETRRVVLLR